MERYIGIPALTQKELEYLHSTMHPCSEILAHFLSAAQVNQYGMLRGQVTRLCYGSLADNIGMGTSLC